MKPLYIEGKKIFNQAILLSDEDRNSFVKQQCANNVALEDFVLSLIHADRKNINDDDSTESNLKDFLILVEDNVFENQLYGPYRILKKIGRGGMGSVYLAERNDHVYKKKVAIKVLNALHYDKHLYSRFIYERQVLASLEHSNICRLIDGNKNEDGYDYLIMEYIQGDPINRYCDVQKYSIEDRLNLFLQLCGAVSYAHRNLVIHGDIKPNNVLITKDGQVKLLDFGIATPNTTVKSGTLNNNRCFTLGYASPEQMLGKKLTTASDTFSLGVLLYELCCGISPWTNDDRNDMLSEQLSNHAAPIAPSLQIAQLKASGQKSSLLEIEKSRNLTFHKLTKSLRGELDSLILKAVAPSIKQRYYSVNELADDIKRYVNNQPLNLYHSGWFYRQKKWIQRHTFSALLILTLIASVFLISGMSVYYAKVFRNERDLAREAKAETEDANHFIIDLFQMGEPEFAQATSIYVKDWLQSSHKKINTLPAENLKLRATLLEAIGNTYRQVGEYDISLGLLQSSLDNRAKIKPEDLLAISKTQVNLSKTLVKLDRYVEAEKMLTQAMGNSAYSGFSNLEKLETNLLIANVHIFNSDYGKADLLIRNNIDLIEGESLEPTKIIAQSYFRYAQLKSDMGNLEESEKSIEKSLGVYQSLNQVNHPDYSYVVELQGMIKRTKGEYEEAMNIFKKNLELRKKLHGKNDHRYAKTLVSIGLTYNFLREFDRAEIFLVKAMHIRESVFGENHTESIDSYNNLAYLFYDRRNFEKAETYFRKAYENGIATLGREHFYVAIYMSNLAIVLAEQNRFQDAMSYAHQAMVLTEKKHTRTHWRYSVAKSVYGYCVASLGRPEKGLELMEFAYQGLIDSLGNNSHYTHEAKRRIALTSNKLTSY